MTENPSCHLYSPVSSILAVNVKAVCVSGTGAFLLNCFLKLKEYFNLLALIKKIVVS